MTPTEWCQECSTHPCTCPTPIGPWILTVALLVVLVAAFGAVGLLLARTWAP